MDASLRSVWQRDGKPHPIVPLLAKGEGRLRQQTGQGSAVIPNASEEPVGGCFTSFSMTKLKVSFQALFRVIPSQSEESTVDASLRSA